MIPRKYFCLLPAILISVAIISCGRRKLRPDELERNRVFAEIVYREDRRALGNDNFFERNLLASPHPAVSRWSAIALGRIGDPRSLPWLFLAFRAPDAGLRASAAFAVGEIEDRETLKSEARNPDPRARQELGMLLADSAPLVRMRAVEALGKAGFPADLPALTDCVRNTRIDIVPERQAFLDLAITALMRIGDPAALPLLRSLAADLDPQIQWRAANALLRMRAYAVRGLDPEGPEGIRARVQALGEPGGPPASQELAAAVPDSPGPAESTLTDLTCSILATARLDRTVAVIETDRGDIEIELFREDAPATTAAFIRLAQGGFYNGLTFRRVVPFFVIQVGEPRSGQEGGPGYALRCEINMQPFVRGSVGMAPAGKDTGGSQFFVTLSPQPHLDGGYTCFGRVISGMQVADRIIPGDVVRRVRIENDITMFDYRQY
jgi:peptidyl-prolyl cis-trans isomerase B (cyclophilin B)